MMKFNPAEYETVKSRKKRFYEDHEDGRIIVEMINPDEIFNSALFKAYIYFTAEDQEKGLPRATGYAYEVRDVELKVSNQGKTYESVNFSSWTENAEESAVGRALDNAGYSGNLKCSREEMEKASRMNETMKAPINRERATIKFKPETDVMKAKDRIRLGFQILKTADDEEQDLIIKHLGVNTINECDDLVKLNSLLEYLTNKAKGKK